MVSGKSSTGGEGVKLNLGSGKKQFPVEEGWNNVDSLALPGITEVVDLFRYPFPWATNSVSHIYCGHLIEHIPHEAHISDWPMMDRKASDPFLTDAWVKRLLSLDGFFAFFAECWRVLEPGGTIECLAPYGMSRGAMQDPVHCRFIVETTVNYLLDRPHEGGTFDYALPFTYDIEGGFRVSYQFEAAALQQAGMFEEANKRMRELWNQVAEIGFTLKAVKDEQMRPAGA